MPVDPKRVYFATFAAKNRVERALQTAKNFSKDPKKTVRLSAQQCVTCFYTSKIVGQAFSAWKCQACLKEQPNWPNTGVPDLCVPCAEEAGVCRECTADMNLTDRPNP